jgi:hypothetical protein
MRNRIFFLASVGLVAFALVATTDAQPPGKKGFGKKGGPFGQPVTVEQIVERIMSYDKNKDGKITADELPERMQHLVAMGDTNRDGALDRAEAEKLASTLESFLGFAAAGGPGGVGPKGDGPKGGKGPPGKGGPEGPLMRVLDDLNLTGTTREKATSVVRSHGEKVRRLEQMARLELLVRMKEVLTEEDFKAFKAEADNLPPPKGFGPPGKGFGGKKGFGPPDRGFDPEKGEKGFGPPKGPPPTREELVKRLEQYQKELDELRRQLDK